MTLAGRKPVGGVCFSYAAYAKALIDYLINWDIPVEPGLSDAEVSSVESAFGFDFPPDLRSVLQEGLPVGPGFPNWRSSSKQQLEIVIKLPAMGICREVSRNGLWARSWGDRPADADSASNLAWEFLKKSPNLVPVYRRFYVPSTPCSAGNPVFYVHGGDVKLWGFDIYGFFQRVEFGDREEEVSQLRRRRVDNVLLLPAWAAKEARRVEFWTDLAEAVAKDGDLGGCLEEVRKILRDGGWMEEEIREMTAVDGCDGADQEGREPIGVGQVEILRVLSGRLLRAGWSRGDVEEALGY